MNISKITKNVELVNDLFNAGFTTKAAKTKALSALNSAYNSIRDTLQSKILEVRTPENDQIMTDLYYAVPDDLHQYRTEKHTDLILNLIPELTEQTAMINELVEMRIAIKNAEVVKLEKTEKEEVRIQKSIREIMETRKAQYERGLKLSDLFNGLNVSANVHYVTNQQGTTFLRAFYYLHGTLTPLNVIIAVAQKLAEKDQK